MEPVPAAADSAGRALQRCTIEVYFFAFDLRFEGEAAEELEAVAVTAGSAADALESEAEAAAEGGAAVLASDAGAAGSSARFWAMSEV